MSPKHFQDPEKFIPERWLEEPNAPFLTFGLGKRSCFGRKLALVEIKLMLYYLLKVCYVCFFIISSIQLYNRNIPSSMILITNTTGILDLYLRRKASLLRSLNEKIAHKVSYHLLTSMHSPYELSR
mgnify:CR=1 FL=1